MRKKFLCAYNIHIFINNNNSSKQLEYTRGESDSGVALNQTEIRYNYIFPID